jgi:hypothetical protein
MTRTLPKIPKIFTVESANACLPLVRVITADLLQLSRELVDRRERCETLTRGRDMGHGDPYSQELAQVQRDLTRDATRLHGFERELLELGVVSQSATEGLVDFPAVIDGRLVYLCWKYNEPELLYWHERDAGFAGRQALIAESLAGGNPDDLDGSLLRDSS